MADDFAFNPKYKKSLPNPYNPASKTSKPRVSKKEHHTPEPVNKFSEETADGR